MGSLAASAAPLESSNSLPLYQQLQRILRKAIHEKNILPNDALPAEREIADEFCVSRITVRKALDGLVNEGLVERRPGSGTFVSPRFEKTFSKLTSFSEDMASRGWLSSSRWLGRSDGTVTPEESLSLGLTPGIKVYRFSRIRYADGVPMALEDSTVPAFCLPHLNAVKTSLYAALDLTDHRPVRALQRLRAVLFTPEQKQLLEINGEEAGLFIERRGFLADGQTVEITRSYYRGDAYDFVAQLNI